VSPLGTPLTPLISRRSTARGPYAHFGCPNSYMAVFLGLSWLKDQRFAEVQTIISHYGAEILLNIDGMTADTLTLPGEFTLRVFARERNRP
jgi:hypothetical protein